MRQTALKLSPVGWGQCLEGDQLQTEAKPCCASFISFLLSQIFFQPLSFLFNSAKTQQKCINVQSVLGQWRSSTWLVIFFGLVLSLKLQIELVGFTDRKRFTWPSGKASSDFYSESLSVECLCCYICNAAGRRFQTKPRIWFTLIKTYKIATFLGYLDYLAQFKLYAYVRKASNAI